MRSILLMILMLSSSAHLVLGQSSVSVQPSLRYGQILGQPRDFKKALYGFSIDINKATYGEHIWQIAHKYPQMGIQFTATKSAEMMVGNQFSLIPYLEFNIWKSNFGTLQIKHGTGLAYVTRRHHQTSNPENKLLGTKLNAASIIDLGYLIKLGSALNVKAGFSLGHISNGNLVQPNAGLNSITGYGTMLYYFDGKSHEEKRENAPIQIKRWRYRFAAITGLYDYDKVTKNLHTNNQLSLLAFYQHGMRFRTGLGTEVSQLNRGSATATAIYAEEEVLIGHLVTRYGIGLYVLNPDEKSLLYEKVGIAWYPFPLKNQVAEKFSIGTAIKAHAFRAAHVEIAAGYTF
ncbi:acyloxyacyl hydrolase [Dyadobacter sp. CY312]|uniref:acyloxyacyl hydrolase n=1 Tax=Dyadobacter sp. CY312 TaxID=2907303 RepID=UPI001F4364C5|nr:acyloxyacyl hydrolase [Dyadobacter sp. CY312]MCE7042421.1 acyloxyacyl hydrolase [Dyadobacter sp. CY312]